MTTATSTTVKRDRHETLLRLVRETTLRTQQDLVAALRDCDFDVTQATVSRDIRELNLLKVRDGLGEPRYVQGAAATLRSEPSERLAQMLDQFSAAVVPAMNQVVIKGSQGCANILGDALDQVGVDGVLATIAGDDTLLIICPDESAAIGVAESLMRLSMNRLA